MDLITYNTSIRRWKSLPIPGNTVNNGVKFSFITWNILAQTLLNQHSHLYTKCNSKALQWENRLNAIIKILSHHGTDIFCLQEVEQHAYGRLKNVFSKNYHSTFKKRTGDKCDGLALFILKESFTVLEFKKLEYKQVAEDLYDNVGIIAILRTNVSKDVNQFPRELCISTTHLIFNPKRGDKKLRQLLALLQEMDKLVTKYQSEYSIPVIVAGDFNLLPNSAIYDFLHRKYGRLMTTEEGFLSGQRKPKHSSKSQNIIEASTEELLYQNPFILKCAYAPHKNGSNEPYITSIHNDSESTVDYIIYGSQAKNVCMKQTKLLCSSILEPPMGRDKCLLPTIFEPSDHYLLAAEFRLV